MITPVDIQNKEFPKKMSGYDRLLVDEFMLEVSDAYEKIYRENIDLKDKLSNLNESCGSSRRRPLQCDFKLTAI